MLAASQFRPPGFQTADQSNLYEQLVWRGTGGVRDVWKLPKTALGASVFFLEAIKRGLGPFTI